MNIPEKNIREKIGERIKQLRTELAITQESVAWRSDIDRTYMNHVENGKRNISVESLEKIIVQGLDSSLRTFFDSELFE